MRCHSPFLVGEGPKRGGTRSLSRSRSWSRSGSPPWWGRVCPSRREAPGRGADIPGWGRDRRDHTEIPNAPLRGHPASHPLVLALLLVLATSPRQGRCPVRAEGGTALFLRIPKPFSKSPKTVPFFPFPGVSSLEESGRLSPGIAS